MLGRTVDELLDSISYRELVDWALYYKEEPWGEWRADLRIAQLTALTANINRDSKKRSQAYQPADFMPLVKRLKRSSEDEQVLEDGQQSESSDDGGGTRVAPETMQWLFAMGRVKNV